MSRKIKTQKDVSKIAVVYARFSSHNQQEQSIEGQISAAHAYAQAKGYKIIHEYADRAKTGRNDNREQFQNMLSDTAKHQFGVIILWKIDRFGRSKEEINLNKYKCKRHGVRVEYVAETIPDTPEGVILESVLEGFAEYYSLQLSQNVRRGLIESAKKCQSTGQVPMGYAVGPDKKYILDPKTAPTVKLIFNLYAAGKTQPEIIDYLNERGLKTNKGRPFTRTSLQTVLKNEKYKGIYIFKDIRIEGGMPRIIDNDTFEKVQQMLKFNSRAPAHLWTKEDYILMDKLFCGKCGSAMWGESGTGKSGTKYHYYLCSNHKKKEGCDKKAVAQDRIENAVIAHTLKLLADDELIEFLIDNTWEFYSAQDETKDEQIALEKELAQVEKSIGNLLKAIEAGIINDATKKRMDELNDEKETLELKIAELNIVQDLHMTKDFIRDYFYGLRNKDYTDREMQKQLIQTFVNSVFLYDDDMKINYNFTTDSHTISVREIEAANTGEVFVHRPVSPATQKTA